MPFIKIKSIRDLTERRLPSTVPGGQDILIDLAAAYQIGRSLTMKQLILLRGGSATTIRKRINQLVDAGHVIKIPNASDGRSDHFSVSPDLWAQFQDIELELTQINLAFTQRTNRTHDSACATLAADPTGRHHV